jgi:hypothetical protein
MLKQYNILYIGDIRYILKFIKKLILLLINHIKDDEIDHHQTIMKDLADTYY